VWAEVINRQEQYELTLDELQEYANIVLTDGDSMIKEAWLLSKLAYYNKSTFPSFEKFLSASKIPDILEWIDSPESTKWNAWVRSYFENKGIDDPIYIACVWGVLARIISGEFDSTEDQKIYKYLKLEIKFFDEEPANK